MMLGDDPVTLKVFSRFPARNPYCTLYTLYRVIQKFTVSMISMIRSKIWQRDEIC